LPDNEIWQTQKWQDALALPGLSAAAKMKFGDRNSGDMKIGGWLQILLKLVPVTNFLDRVPYFVHYPDNGISIYHCSRNSAYHFQGDYEVFLL